MGVVAALVPNNTTTQRPAVQGFLDTGNTSAPTIAATTTTRPAVTTTTPVTAAATTPPTAAPVTTAAPAPPPPTAPATDPRFGTCKEAKAHGYGPYVRGRDPEYSWYRDGDGDGVTCE